jgi:hypothetical protein
MREKVSPQATDEGQRNSAISARTLTPTLSRER